jgi:transcriptional regulator with XRE-family HTH domain
MADRESRLPETLAALIEQRGYARNRRAITDAVGVSGSALSQYVRGNATPSLEKVMALADFFGVSLDELVYGTPSLTGGTPESSVLRAVQEAVGRSQAQTAAHSALVARVARQLSDQMAARIDTATQEALGASSVGGQVLEGVVVDEELVRLEAHALRADIVTIDLDANVIAMPDGDSAEGTFLDVVTVALGRGCQYRFLVSSEPRTRDESIRGFRDLLSERVGEDVVAAQCAIRRAVTPTLLGMGLYQLDTARLRSEDPSTYAQFQSYIDIDGWFGYVIRPMPAAGKDSVMDTRRRTTARAFFESLWTNAELAQ